MSLSVYFKSFSSCKVADSACNPIYPVHAFKVGRDGAGL